MQSAGLSPRQLAVKVGVSGKTIERWISDGELIPHARNREDACRALGVDEDIEFPLASAVLRDRLSLCLIAVHPGRPKAESDGCHRGAEDQRGAPHPGRYENVAVTGLRLRCSRGAKPEGCQHGNDDQHGTGLQRDRILLLRGARSVRSTRCPLPSQRLRQGLSSQPRPLTGKARLATVEESSLTAP